MALIVQKYGGTSVGTPERIQAVADRIICWVQRGHEVVVVVSAMAGETNRLVELINAIDPAGSAREKDVILATGEQVTIGLLSMALQNKGQDARSYTGNQVKILTDTAHTKARICHIDDGPICADLDKGRVVIVAGFQGVDDSGNITTLGRGGSDTTAVALAVALQADECQIYTDVDGVYTTDPRVEPQAHHIPQLSLEEMLEMASQGSKVLQIRAVEFAYKHNMPLRVLSSFDNDKVAPRSTLITCEDNAMEEVMVRGIAFNRDEAQLTISGVPDQPGIAYRILGPVSDANIEVDMIIQNVGRDGLTDFTFTVHRNDLEKASHLLEQTAATLDAGRCEFDDHIAKISIVGAGMRSHAGVASKMFKVLAEEGVNVRLVSTSEIKVSVVVDERYLELAVRVLHEAFEATRLFQIPLPHVPTKNNAGIQVISA